MNYSMDRMAVENFMGSMTHIRDLLLPGLWVLSGGSIMDLYIDRRDSLILRTPTQERIIVTKKALDDGEDKSAIIARFKSAVSDLKVAA